MKKTIGKFIIDLNGATAVEYALVAAGIGLVLFGVLSVIGTDMADMFGVISANFNK